MCFIHGHLRGKKNTIFCFVLKKCYFLKSTFKKA
jgi:hypothetical protein